MVAEEEAEGRRFSEAPHLLTVVLGARRLAGVFEKDEVVPVGGVLDSVHPAWIPKEMHQEDRLCARCDRPLDCVRVDVVRVPLHIDQDRRCSYLSNREDRGGPGERGRDDLVSLIEPVGREEQQVRAGAGVRHDGVLDADVLSPSILEGFHLLPHRDPAGHHGVQRLDHLIGAERRHLERDRRLPRHKGTTRPIRHVRANG